MMAGPELFGRTCSLVIAPIDGGAGLDVSGLRIQFEVKKTHTSEPNAATIRVWNLAKGSRDRIRAKLQAVTLKAGYIDLVRTLSAGVISRIEHEQQPPDVVTSIEIRDGGRGLDSCEFRASYAAGSRKWEILDDIIAAMTGVSRGSLQASGLDGKTSSRLAFSCSARRALDRCARAWGFEWSVQDGSIQVLDRTRALSSKEFAVVLSSTTGMIGTPTVTSGGGKGKAAKSASGCKVKSLLLPQLRPGSYLEVQSNLVAGYFKALAVTHTGDTHAAEPWFTETEAKRI
jgi:hypothetical protein